jgi:hypothetical protein
VRDAEMIPSLRREEEKRKKGEEEILSSFLSSFSVR